MAGVDHAYQYSVEVKSRFSLFMDDSLNNEDPDLLISKLRNERVERVKKDKINTTVTRSDTKKVEQEPEVEVKQEVNDPKGKQVRMPRSAAPVHEENAETAEHAEKSETVSGLAFRGRGGPRGFSRGFRGNRGQGPRSYHAESTQNGMDELPPRESSYESRGRGRSRPRGIFNRGRGMPNTDYREASGQFGADASHARHTDNTQSNWNDQDAVNAAPDAREDGVADVTPDDTCVAEENQEGGDKDSSAEEPKHYTLDEYKAMRSQSKQTITLASKGSRKANDGQDVFANMVAHRKTVEVSDDDTEEVEREEEEPQKFEINFSFNDEFGNRGRQNRGFGNRGLPRGGGGFRGSRPRTERGSRGVRGSFRGESRGRGIQRGMPPQGVYTPVIYNDQEFPSLK